MDLSTGLFSQYASFRIEPLMLTIRLDASAFPLVVGICLFATTAQDLILDGSDASYY
jgi:hypothetical protein